MSACMVSQSRQSKQILGIKIVHTMFAVKSNFACTSFFPVVQFFYLITSESLVVHN